MTTNQAVAYVKARFPLAKLEKTRRGRTIVHTHGGFGVPLWLGTFGGYCRPEKAWKIAARILRRNDR